VEGGRDMGVDEEVKAERPNFFNEPCETPLF